MNLTKHWNATKIGVAGAVLSAAAAGGFYMRIQNIATPENILANIAENNAEYEEFCKARPTGSLGHTPGPDIPWTPLGKPIHPYTTEDECKRNLAYESVTFPPFMGMQISGQAAVLFPAIPVIAAIKRRQERLLQELLEAAESEPAPPSV